MLYVGATNDAVSGDQRGVVYVFGKEDNTWIMQETITDTAAQATADDDFGSAIALSPNENTLVVGAAGDDTGGNDRGAIHILTRQNNAWVRTQKIDTDTVGTYS